LCQLLAGFWRSEGKKNHSRKTFQALFGTVFFCAPVSKNGWTLVKYPDFLVVWGV
jgi:hypothetical protein